MSTPTEPPPPPAYRRDPLRVACVQYDVKLGRVAENQAKVEKMTKGLRPGSLDLLVLPEMALSGYVFTTPISILPYLENTYTGPTSILASALARRLGCHVIAGYPEALPPPSSAFAAEGTPVAGSSSSTGNLDSGIDNGDTGGKAMKALEGEGVGVGWNSAIVVGPEGQVIGNYRKTFRFDTDKNWAREGDGFKYFDLAAPLGRTAVGICMDMNPKDFIAPWDAYELANFCRDNKVETLVVPMNWLSPSEEPPEDAPAPDPDAPSESNLNYWAARLQPLHDPAPGYASPNPDSAAGGAKEVVFVSCNRVGEEEGSKFVGTSCVMTVSSDPSRIELVECCNSTEERVMLATVTWQVPYSTDPDMNSPLTKCARVSANL